MAGSGDSCTVWRTRDARPRSVETRATHSNGAHSQQFEVQSGPGVALAIKNLRLVYTKASRCARSAMASIKSGLANARPTPPAVSAFKFGSTPWQIVHLAAFSCIRNANCSSQAQPLGHFGLRIAENVLRCCAWRTFPHCAGVRLGCAKLCNCRHFRQCRPSAQGVELSPRSSPLAKL